MRRLAELIALEIAFDPSEDSVSEIEDWLAQHPEHEQFTIAELAACFLLWNEQVELVKD